MVILHRHTDTFIQPEFARCLIASGWLSAPRLCFGSACGSRHEDQESASNQQYQSDRHVFPFLGAFTTQDPIGLAPLSASGLAADKALEVNDFIGNKGKNFKEKLTPTHDGLVKGTD
jgi:hypothetical protein